MPDQERGGISMPSGAWEAESHGQLVRYHCEKHGLVGTTSTWKAESHGQFGLPEELNACGRAHLQAPWDAGACHD